METRNIGGGGSQPDLREMAKQCSSEMQQVTFRHKRKQPDEDLAMRFDEFERKILSAFTNMADTQNEKLNTISNDISLIKDQMAQMKSTTENLVLEHTKFKQDMASLKECTIGAEQRIKTIEDEIGALKTSTASQLLPQELSYDGMINEINERSQREKNLIIYGIDEIHSKSSEERRCHDMDQVNKLMQSVVLDCAKPLKVIRLGKYDANRVRLIKVSFATSETPKTILRNKLSVYKDQPKIKIYADETPYQKKSMKNLRDELKRRTEAGEKDLIIKYIKGVPKIIESASKN